MATALGLWVGIFSSAREVRAMHNLATPFRKTVLNSVDPSRTLYLCRQDYSFGVYLFFVEGKMDDEDLWMNTFWLSGGRLRKPKKQLLDG
jgi:hypothetical protein